MYNPLARKSELIPTESAKKHVLHMHDVLRKFDSQKRIYPNGLVGSLKGTEEMAEKIKRIELFAEEHSKESYGIIRQFFVAYSSERNLLQLAHASENVICVRAMPSSPRERRILPGVDRRGMALENRMILKRSEQAPEEPSYRPTIPNLIVSQHWLEMMELEAGDRIIISNPIEKYMVPPPGLENS